MKKTIFTVIFLLMIISAGSFFFLRKDVLPQDFNTLIMLWQKERSKDFGHLFSLWAEMPIGQGIRTADIDLNYSGLSFSGKIGGPIVSDIHTGQSLWKANLDLTGKSSMQGLPLPSQIAISGGVQIGQGSFFYMIPGQLTVSLPSQSSALQKQLQEIANIASNKTLKINDQNPSFFRLSAWLDFFEDFSSKPIFLLARTEGELSGRYEYTISLAPSYSELFQSVIVPMTNCQLSIAKRNIDDFLLDCRSPETRIVWTGKEDKIPVEAQYKETYLLSITSSEKPKWEFEHYQGNKKVGEIEGSSERLGNKLFWDATTENIPEGYSINIRGNETRATTDNIHIETPQTFIPWEEMTKELVY